MKHYQVLADAIQNRDVLEISYRGDTRVVEPHLIGVTLAQNVALSAFQTVAKSGAGFRLFLLDEIEAVELTGETFEGERDGFNRNDKTMSEVWVTL